MQNCPEQYKLSNFIFENLRITAGKYGSSENQIENAEIKDVYVKVE